MFVKIAQTQIFQRIPPPLKDNTMLLEKCIQEKNSLYQLETESLNEDFSKRMLLFIGRLHCVRMNFPPAFPPSIQHASKTIFPIQHNVKSYALAHRTKTHCSPHIRPSMYQWWPAVLSRIRRSHGSTDRFRWKWNNKLANYYRFK